MEDEKATGRKRQVIHAAPSADVASDVSRDMALTEFARRLQQAYTKKGWNQSETARKASVFTERPITRDLISKYVAMKTGPSPTNLAALAKAFGMEPNDLMPTRGLTAAMDRNPPLEVRQLDNGSYSLRINKVVPASIAMRILGILGELDEEGK